MKTISIRNLLLASALTACGVVAWQASRPATVSAAASLAAPEKINVDYAPVEAFLKANCVECHNADKQKGDVTLDNYHDVNAVLRDRKVWDTALEKVRAGEMPPKKKARPDKAQQQVFLRTIDQIFYQHDLTHPLDPGQVTIRRLNRTEYNNTIRDLCGVDSRPADDFPSDDVGQGFDNIGDVLSISPVLMERYIAAADAVLQMAIPPNPLPPLFHNVNGKNMDPPVRDGEVPDKQSRPLTAGNSVFSKYSVREEGEYKLRFEVYPDLPVDEGEQARVTLLIDGRKLDTFQVGDGDRRHLLTFEVKQYLKPGEHKFEMALLNGWQNDPKWILRVRQSDLIGPPDTRPASQKMLLACDANASKLDKTRQILSRFARRAYRRTPTDAEVEHLVDFAERSTSQGQTWEAGISLAMEGVLISPKFLFRVELDNRPDAKDPHPIDEFQLASRLSYFLWSTMPDDELLDLAAKNELTANLEAQVRRMLKDSRSEALVDNFAMQWLQLRRLKNFAPDPGMFPNFNDQLRNDMLTETKLFVGSVFREDHSILDLIDADYTFLNQRLSRFYGIGMDGRPMANAGDNGGSGYRRGRNFDTAFQRVKLADHTRGGILTEASVLAVTSNPTRTSPVKRGKFVLEQILGMPPPPPPPNVPQLEDVKVAGNGAAAHVSLRQRMEQHRADPSCANCHEHMDGMGFAFENFDAIGGYRSTEGGMEIDPSGTLPDGESFRGSVPLKALLKQRTDLFSRCLTKKLMIYATGRGMEYYDQRAVDKIVSALKENDFKFSTLVVEIAKSDPFLKRRGKEQTP